MKKLLIASTALVMVAGAAAAEVKLSGDARMGVVYDGADWNFSSRSRVTFTLSGTTDTGLEFGAVFQADDADSENGAAGAENGTSGTVFLSGAFGRIEMGDVTSAPEALFGDFYEVGYTDLSSQGLGALGALGENDIPYLTLDNNNQSGLLYTYSAGAFSVAAAASDGIGDATTIYGGVVYPVEQTFSVAAAYVAGNYTVGVGYEKVEGSVVGTDGEQLELVGSAKFGATNVKAYYADGEIANVDVKGYGVGVDTTFGATTIGGYVQKGEVGAADATWYGLGASYDLGGGAAIRGGIADNDLANTDMVADFGVTFRF